jgi:hypothetical protein
MQDTPYGLCHCGCGERTALARKNDSGRGYIKGEPKRFRAGHFAAKSRIFWLEEDHGYSTPCWVWKRNKTLNGYAQRVATSKQSGTNYVHIQNYVAKYGPVPEGLDLDHLCRVRACVNPDHLEAVTRRENIRRSAKTILNEDKAAEIRRLGAEGAKIKELAARFGISDTLAGDVRSGKRWAA